ncbi:RdgB/HAM1 family non-canonical purine NTP pyrophosphatase [Rheinheimera sp.]|uniref:RdgB/HAM1 family non-canonical purine NTP pyrophosphatase n=1 Tax=Rheinheimera sp. TaxID=1869214 RepID=UPI0027353E08|nr:RdgB/HAM1 family non-canonical purine NTP pyrophosphatase [Rheinheimera sp.]MDP2713881.1 RdgB/HAM1 family non-canonical purine NTP pyrophosphatase [Rheinheimera sp.]
MTKKIVLATGNKGKVAELSQMLAPFQYQIVPQSELAVSDADETGLTFIENAIIKARHAALATGLPAIADDSGLAVDALGGAPGIYSARYAGEAATDADNIAKLLQALKDVPKAQRSAQFHCVLVYLRHAEDPTPLVCHGVWHGDITMAPQGNGGFGYDPVFYVAAEGCTSAELSRERKAQLSHRGKALAQLLSQLTRPQG